MGNSRYLVAKYVPDVFRNEPVNIGVLTWIDGKVEWKFLGERPDRSIDGKARGIFGRIKSVPNFKQWVECWTSRLNAPKLKTKQHGEVCRQSPEFLDALSTFSGGNYILEAGGELLDETSPDEIGEVTTYLFNTLVGVPEEKDAYKSADEMRNDLLRDAGVNLLDPRVKLNHPVPLQLRGRDFKPEFSIYIGNGTPEALGQMVPLTAQGRTAQNSARAAELLFLKVLDARVLPQEKCAAFVYRREDEEPNDLIEKSIEELSFVSTVVDISKDRKSAIEKLSSWVKDAKRH